MTDIKKVKLFPSESEKSLKVAKELAIKLANKGYKFSDDNFDLAIAIGGDGAFLHMVKNCNFDENIKYIGVHTGTLGFAQEIDPDKLDDFFKDLEEERYKIENIRIQETTVNNDKYYSLNEIVIRDINLKTAYLEILIDNQMLEKFVGDGVLICTSFGSTAYNFNLRGAIVYSDFDTLQISPLAPSNHNVYRNLLNSVIVPGNRIITIKPIDRTKDLLLIADDNQIRLENNTSIETKIGKHIKCLRTNNYDYTKRINEKYTKA